jgi:DNA-binding transcriptional LysR family regulator
MLRDGDIDLAFVTTAIEAPPPDLAERTLARDPFALIVGPDVAGMPDPFRSKGRPPALGPARGAGRVPASGRCAVCRAGTPVPRDAVRCDSLLTTKALVRDCTRVTILPMQVAAANCRWACCAPCPRRGGFERSIGARWLKGRHVADGRCPAPENW